MHGENMHAHENMQTWTMVLLLWGESANHNSTMNPLMLFVFFQIS